jgi:hypothetical protein
MNEEEEVQSDQASEELLEALERGFLIPNLKALELAEIVRKQMEEINNA